MSLDSTLIKTAETYFKVWNSKNLTDLKACFVSSGGYLRDWDVEVKGTDNVVEANGKIFKAVPKIAIEVLKLHPNSSGPSICCEILVKLNNDENVVLKVVDVIETNSDGTLIQSLRAYKG